jgi:serine/threonine-protein kinase
MKPIACDRELLRLSLDDALSDQQEEELARHLAECSACQSELERLAAEQHEWSRVGDVLRREAASSRSNLRPGLAASSDASADGGGSGLPPFDGYADSLADFAVHFLEASSSAGAIGRLGDIDILEVIGRGGMGIVLKGFQQELNRPVAVKVLAPHLAANGPRGSGLPARRRRQP